MHYFFPPNIVSITKSYNDLKMIKNAEVDTGFPVGGGANSWGSANIQISWISPKST